MATTTAAAHPPIAILGGGNLGQSLARGWTGAGLGPPEGVRLTRRQVEKLEPLADEGFSVGADNRAAVEGAGLVVLAVQPQQLGALLDDVVPALPPAATVVSVVSGVTLAELGRRVPHDERLVRAMPNTAVAIRQSMTCLCAAPGAPEALERTRALFDALGRTLVIPEDMMTPATALCACGVAFFLRAVRAASQGGIEIGFHPEEALLLAAQTAHGAAALLLGDDAHPEPEIDRVTTPRGCTIAGLNEMEHRGFSSALIRGIVVSAAKAGELYPGDD